MSLRPRTPEELWKQNLYCPSCFGKIAEVETEDNSGVFELYCQSCNIAGTEKEIRKLLPPEGPR